MDHATDIPEALHRGFDELPLVPFDDGLEMALLQVDLSTGLWVVNARFAPGLTLQRHQHTGEVFAVTRSGRWCYLEYPVMNEAGSYLFEPAGSTHTLHTPDDNAGPTEVWFAVRGNNLNLDEAGNVVSTVTAAKMLKIYRKLCAEAGLPSPEVIGAPPA